MTTKAPKLIRVIHNEDGTSNFLIEKENGDQLWLNNCYPTKRDVVELPNIEAEEQITFKYESSKKP